jgi:hypothetical protein
MRVRKADRTAAIQQLDQERKAFASEVTLLKHRAGELGLFYTMQKLDLAVLQVGYELAGTPELGFKKELTPVNPKDGYGGFGRTAQND